MSNPTSNSSTSSDSAQVLVVDDEPIIRQTLAQALTSIGHDVKTAINGEDALQALADHPVELVLCDLKMPGMDGMELVSNIAQRYPQIQVIMISAHGTVTNAVEAMKLGAVDFIQKPFTPNEIRELVNQVLMRPQVARKQTQTAVSPPSPEPPKALGHDTYLEMAKYQIQQREYDQAIAQVKQAIGQDPSSAVAFNLLGELLELIGDRLEALKNYRVALDLEPTYEPALANLDRATTHPQDRPTI